MLTQEQIQTYHDDGYLIVKSFFDAEEIELLRRTAVADRQMDQKSFGREDGEGGTVAWAWHQDYGYWYDNYVLYPLMSSVSIAVDAATRENGCMQVLKGSHHMGRITHVETGQQAGADLERVTEAEKRLELVHCEAEPGDALFFHCNILHRSDQNRSQKPRWSLICCYNAARNDPYREAHHPSYTPLHKVDDRAIKEVGMKRFEDDESDVAFLDPDTVPTAQTDQ